MADIDNESTLLDMLYCPGKNTNTVCEQRNKKERKRRMHGISQLNSKIY